MFLLLQDLRCSLLAQVQSAPCEILDELKIRLQLKDRLFQEVLANRTHQAQEHQAQVQDLLRTISSRDQYIQVEQRSSVEAFNIISLIQKKVTLIPPLQDSACRLGEVMTEQADRIQELRRQLSTGVGSRSDSGPDSSVDLQVVQEELCLALRRGKESQELSRSQASRVESLTRTLYVKEDIIRVSERDLCQLV